MHPHLFVLLLSAACAAQPYDDRVATDRTPLDRDCDSTDPSRCALPWPSNIFTVADAHTATGLRLDLHADDLVIDDRTTYLNRADGFSRVTGVAVAILGGILPDALSWDPARSLANDSALQVIDIQPDSASYGQRFPYRTEAYDGSDALDTRHLVVGHPVQVLPAATDFALVVTDALSEVNGAPRSVRVALGLAEADTPDERELAAWHAPTRAGLDAAGVDLESVLRVSVFTTRSNSNTVRRLRSMTGTLNAYKGELEPEIDAVITSGSRHIAFIVRGRLHGAPNFLDADGYLMLDSDGLPQPNGTTAIEFRMTIPAGTADYRVAMYGHGTGGNVNDSSFDREMAEQNIAKLNLRYDGWTDDDFVKTIAGFQTMLDGSERSTAGLMQSVAGGTLLLSSLDLELGDLLSADTLDGAANTAAGRHPLTQSVAWVGGSMGGTMGAVMVGAEPRFQIGVLNVPGAGWTHLIPHSLLYHSSMEGIMLEIYRSQFDIQHAIVMAQGSWDDVDGAVWADEALAAGGTFLIQESMDDPVLPNLGTELLANALGARMTQPELEPIVGVSAAPDVSTGGTVITQFRVPDTGPYDVHGFAARNTVAGDAALGQILDFLNSSWAGDAQIQHPAGCAITPDGSCDFTSVWED